MTLETSKWIIEDLRKSINLAIKQCIIGLQREKPRSICPDHVIGQLEIPDLGPDVIGVPEPKDFIGRDVIGLQEVPDLGSDVIRIGGDIKPQPIQDNIIMGPK